MFKRILLFLNFGVVLDTVTVHLHIVLAVLKRGQLFQGNAVVAPDHFHHTAVYNLACIVADHHGGVFGSGGAERNGKLGEERIRVDIHTGSFSQAQSYYVGKAVSAVLIYLTDPVVNIFSVSGSIVLMIVVSQ